MGPCCVQGCEVTSEETFYFEFPTSRLLRRKWLELIPISGKLPLGTVVCSRHFNQDEYESIRGKVRLKRKVVPSLYLEQRPTTPSQIPLPPTPAPKITTPPSSPRSTPPPKSPEPNTPPSKSPEPNTPPPKSPERKTPPSTPTLDPCDATSIPMPIPVDAEKLIDVEIKKRMGEAVAMVTRTQNGIGGGEKSGGKSPPVVPAEPVLDPKEDIEDMITNYHIKNKVPNPALLADLMPNPELMPYIPPLNYLPMPAPRLAVPVQNNEPIEIEDQEAPPVIIEVAVDKGPGTAGTGNEDCLMLLESVQVDVDPSSLLLTHSEDYYPYEEEPARPHKKEDPISLLTSSDDDDVILQEPHIDTVEVSDETDEDDMPLVKLVKKTDAPKKKHTKKKSRTKKRTDIEKIMWGMYDFYCIQCHFSTKDALEYKKHVSEHSKVLHVCPICSYTSASKSMFSRHTRIHKVEKKFKCHLCEFRARHKMSLIYHLKKHDLQSGNNKDFQCKRCNFQSNTKAEVLEHLSKCRPSEKIHACMKCDYSTKKKSDLKRHTLRRHATESDDPECIS